MQDKCEDKARGPSRRQVLAGAAVAALAAGARSVLAEPKARQTIRGAKPTPTTTPLRRYMAAATALADGRILITGGYDRAWTDEVTPSPLNSAVIYDPRNGSWFQAASMMTPRARHAAVTLGDGRIAVLGGLGQTATPSVEIYDPRTNTWKSGEPLAQPRYDHCAVFDGGNIVVLGGSAVSMLSSVEVYQP